MSIEYIPPQHIERDGWQKIAALLDRVCKSGDHTTESVIQEIITGTCHAWSINDFESLCVTRVHQRPRGRILCLDWMAGKGFKSWVGELQDKLTEFALFMDCEIIEAATARKGFERWKTEGFEPEYIVYRKKVSSL